MLRSEAIASPAHEAAVDATRSHDPPCGVRDDAAGAGSCDVGHAYRRAGGVWCSGPDGNLAYATFLPASLHLPAIAASLSVWALHRAQMTWALLKEL